MTQEKLLKAAGLGHEISAREAWKLFGIMAEFFETTERLGGIRPAVSGCGTLDELFEALTLVHEPAPAEREVPLNL